MPYHKDGDAVLLKVRVFSGHPETIGESEIEALKPYVHPMANGKYIYVPCYAMLFRLREEALKSQVKP